MKKAEGYTSDRRIPVKEKKGTIHLAPGKNKMTGNLRKRKGHSS